MGTSRQKWRTSECHCFRGELGQQFNLSEIGGIGVQSLRSGSCSRGEIELLTFSETLSRESGESMAKQIRTTWESG